MNAPSNNKLGLFSYLKLGLATEIGWLVKLGYVLGIIFTVLIFFTGYRFFTADQDGQVFWGVCLLLSVNAQIATKLWIYQQTNHSILLQEIRKTKGQ